MKKMFAIVMALILCLSSVSALAVGEEFVGLWATEDGNTVVCLTEDGVVVMAMGEATQETTWLVDEAGNAQFVLGPGSAVPMIVNEEGCLEIRADNMTLVLLPVNPFVGDWMTEDGSTKVTLTAEGVVVMSVGEQTQETTWTVDEDGNVWFVLGPSSAVPMIINEDGCLEIQADNMTMVLVPVVEE